MFAKFWLSISRDVEQQCGAADAPDAHLLCSLASLLYIIRTAAGAQTQSM